MARRKKNFLAAFALLAVMSIGSLGFGYAFWSDALAVNGTVNTGNLDMRWVGTASTDNETTGPDVATCTVSGATTKSLTVTLSNAYPGYECTVSGSIAQNGSVPGKVTSVTPTFGPGSAAALTFTGPTCATVGTVIGSTVPCTVTVRVNDSNNNSTQAQAYTVNLAIDFENYHP